VKHSIVRQILAVVFLTAGLHAAADAPDALGRPGFGPKFHRGEFFMAPNPVSNSGTITYELSSDGEASMELFGLHGELVRAWMLRGTPDSECQFQVQLSDVPQGFYVLVLTETVNGRSAVVGTFKVAVRH
jgi:hypothetical protein